MIAFIFQSRISTAINGLTQTRTVVRPACFTENTLADKKLFS